MNPIEEEQVGVVSCIVQIEGDIADRVVQMVQSVDVVAVESLSADVSYRDWSILLDIDQHLPVVQVDDPGVGGHCCSDIAADEEETDCGD